ncbi:MAG: phosphonopyruvate decarboxylase, partial [Bacteroidetes bacterium]|nr:phosphonopyruvate decarboxylase [Bacteroidota bacterium]
MLSTENLFLQLKQNGISFFTGVPDSLLKDFCAYVTDHADGSTHVITANEGGAIALATGHYLATGEYALGYMQNSGL